jgi:hypothetical protein
MDAKATKLIPFSIIDDCISALYRHEQQFTNVAIGLRLAILEIRGYS